MDDLTKLSQSEQENQAHENVQMPEIQENEEIQTPEASHAEIAMEEVSTQETIEEPVVIEKQEIVENEQETLVENVHKTEQSSVPAEQAVEEAVTESTSVKPIAEIEEPVAIEKQEIEENKQEMLMEDAPEAEQPSVPVEQEVGETVQEAPIAEIVTEVETSVIETEEKPQSEEISDPVSEEEEIATIEHDEAYASMSREELVAQMESLVQNKDIIEIKNHVSLIKLAYLELNKIERQKLYEQYILEGGVKEEFAPQADATEERFRKIYSHYKEKRQKYLDEQERIKQENLNKKQALLEELKVLIDSDETLKKTYDDFHAIQDKWKEIGAIPREAVNDLWNTYHFLIEQFFNKIKINKELRDLDLRKNMEAKLELCEKAEELLLETSISKSFKALQEYHDKWKEIGPVPMDKKDELWERFKTASDQINKNRQEYYDKLHADHENNLLAKTALCDNAEQVRTRELKTIKEWQSATDELNEMLKVWKTIGMAARKDNDAIWNRFKSALDSFFNMKKEYFDKIKDEQGDNYNRKIDLCLQAEAIALRNDWKQATHDLLNLQKEWKEIGPVPRKHVEKIWERFRAACDTFFANKADFFSNIKGIEEDNLKAKEEIIAQIKQYEMLEDRNANLNVLKEFQRAFTNIGYIPIGEKDRVQKAYREAVNELFEKLKINQSEALRAQFESLDPDEKDRRLSKEKPLLQNKIAKLKEDLVTWENNIGFFAQSKQADLLKKEFEQKIRKSKEELALLEAKLKMLMTMKK